MIAWGLCHTWTKLFKHYFLFFYLCELEFILQNHRPEFMFVELHTRENLDVWPTEMLYHFIILFLLLETFFVSRYIILI